MTVCAACGGELPSAARYCPTCGRAAAPPAPIGAAGPHVAEAYGAPPHGPPIGPYTARGQPHAVSASEAGVPAIGLAGFILSLLGLFSAGVTCLVGLPLSWVGYRQAKRESLPVGLCVAGIAINIAGIILMAGLIALVLLGMALFPEAAPNPYTY